MHDEKRLSGEGQELPGICALGCAGPGASLLQRGLGEVSPALALAASWTHARREERTEKTGVHHHLLLEAPLNFLEVGPRSLFSLGAH